jgi:membrane-bound lytic murein transglycosylase F
MALLLLMELVYAMHWSETGYRPHAVLRVAVPGHEWMQGAPAHLGRGFEQELLDAYCRENGLAWKRLTPKSWNEAWAMLERGEADVVIALGSTPPRALADRVAAGPAYASFKPVIVHNDRRFGVRTDCELCEQPILVSANADLRAALRDQGKALDCAPSAVVGDGLDIVPLLDTLDGNEARFALVDEGRFRMWQPFYHRIRTSRTLPASIAYRWYWDARERPVAESLAAFWERMDKSPALADLYDKYFGFLPEEADPFELAHLLRTVGTRLPRYGATIARAAAENGIDPLLLVAVLYQESRFDPGAVSKTGVRGMMQLTADTARLLGVDRNDPRQSILGGARYLRMLHDAQDDPGLDDDTRWLFALAAYNQGPGHLNDAVALARRLGGAGTSWRELKDAFPKLAWERWYKDARHGYTRGFEAVAFVENIRYYHYILHGLRELDRPEAQMLAAVYDGPEGETARARLAAAPAAAPGPAGPDVATVR